MWRTFKRLVSLVAVAGLAGLVGLAADLVRLQIAQKELQTFVDEATLAANLELDGTGREWCAPKPSRFPIRKIGTTRCASEPK